MLCAEVRQLSFSNAAGQNDLLTHVCDDDIDAVLPVSRLGEFDDELSVLEPDRVVLVADRVIHAGDAVGVPNAVEQL